MKSKNEFVRDIHRKQLQLSFHGEFYKCHFFIEILLKIVVFMIKPKLYKTFRIIFLFTKVDRKEK